MFQRIALLGLFLTGSGCGGAGVVATPTPGDPTAPPGFASLPPIEPTALSERMRFGWLLTEESLALEAPPLPQGRSATTVFAWADGEFRTWLGRKQRTVEAARRELDRAAVESHPQRILAGALVGLLYEDVSRSLLEIPVPEELLREPEILVVYHEVRAGQASPFLEHARRAYRACALNAVGNERFDSWRRYCSIRRDRLPEGRAEVPLASGETEVTVTQELSP